MSKGSTFQADMLRQTFQNLAAAGIGDATGLRGSNTAGSLYFALHTADPGEAGTQATSEIAYTNYARQALARTSGNFNVTENATTPAACTLAAALTFPTAGAGTVAATATFFSVGVAATGAGKILYSGPIVPTIAVSLGVAPQLGTGTTITED